MLCQVVAQLKAGALAIESFADGGLGICMGMALHRGL